MHLTFFFLLAYVFCWLNFPVHVSASVIGIDLGTAWFKIASAKKFRVVLNKQSKRKTEMLVHIAEDQLYFGGQALSLATRSPKNTFSNLKTLLGKKIDSATAQSYFRNFHHDYVSEHERSTVRFKVLEKEEYSVEELMAMILMNAKDIAEHSTGLKVTGAVITIPPFFNQFERQAVLDAAEIAGLNVLSLLHDTTAVGLYFGATQEFSTPEKHIFYDMGAGSTAVALISFSSEKNPKKIQVNHVGYDEEIGGQWVDRLLIEHLVKKFNDMYQDSSFKLKDHPYQYQMFLKKVISTKEMLSLNTEAHFEISNLYQGRDFNLKILRTELEELLLPHKDRIIRPLKKVLESDPSLLGQNATLNSVILAGGSTLIPLIQEWIAELVGKEKVSTRLNSDEAASLGATLYAAKMSPGYRVISIDINETLPYSIRMNKATLFQENSDTFPNSKSVTLKNNAMQSIQIFSRDEMELANVQFGPLTDGVTQINVKMTLDKNGLLSITNVTQIVEASSFFGGKSNSTSPLTFNVTYPIAPHNKSSIEEMRNKLLEWKEKENTIRYRSKMLNELQSLIYGLKSKMKEKLVIRLSTEEERSKIIDFRTEMVEWLDDHENSATLHQIQEHLGQAQERVKDIMTRKKQWESGAASIQKYAEELRDNTLNAWLTEMEEKEVYDLPGLQAKVNETMTKVLEKREKERLEKEAEEAKRREKLLEEVRKKLEEKKLAEEKAAAAANITQEVKVGDNATNATVASNATFSNTTTSDTTSDTTLSEEPSENKIPFEDVPIATESTTDNTESPHSETPTDDAEPSREDL